MTTRIFVPCDTTALAMGADAVAAELAQQARTRGADVEIIRNGNRTHHSKVLSCMLFCVINGFSCSP